MGDPLPNPAHFIDTIVPASTVTVTSESYPLTFINVISVVLFELIANATSAGVTTSPRIRK